MFEEVDKGEKKFMTAPGQPQTYSHLINAQTLTEVCQVVRMISPCQFHVYVSIGTVESDLIIISKYLMWNQIDISLFIKTLQHKC